jgi:hypothetical protein
MGTLADHMAGAARPSRARMAHDAAIRVQLLTSMHPTEVTADTEGTRFYVRVGTTMFLMDRIRARDGGYGVARHPTLMGLCALCRRATPIGVIRELGDMVLLVKQRNLRTLNCRHCGAKGVVGTYFPGSFVEDGMTLVEHEGDVNVAL